MVFCSSYTMTRGSIVKLRLMEEKAACGRRGTRDVISVHGWCWQWRWPTMFRCRYRVVRLKVTVSKDGWDMMRRIAGGRSEQRVYCCRCHADGSKSFVALDMFSCRRLSNPGSKGNTTILQTCYRRAFGVQGRCWICEQLRSQCVYLVSIKKRFLA